MTTPSSPPEVYSDLPWEALPESLRMALPLHKSDTAQAETIVAMGFPAVEPLLPHLMVWLQDYNWPVAQVLAPFLASLGEAIVPEVRKILQGKDEIWIYWVLLKVVVVLPQDALAELQADLEVLAAKPSQEEVDLIASDILAGNLDSYQA